MATDSELTDFLRRVDRLVEPALLFAPRDEADRVMRVMESVFEGRHVFTLRASGPIPPTEAEVAATMRNSFEGRGVLAVFLNEKAPPAVVQAVSRVCTDGVFAEQTAGTWQHTRPPEDWRLVVVAQAASAESLPGHLADGFSAILAL